MNTISYDIVPLITLVTGSITLLIDTFGIVYEIIKHYKSDKQTSS